MAATLVAFGAATAAAVTLGVSDGDRAAAASRPGLVATSFSTDRTILPGKTTTVTARCGRGYSLLAGRFYPLAVEPAGIRSDFKTLAIVPRPKSTSFTFHSTGTATVRIRVTADCVKINGGPSLRTFVVHRVARLGARAARSSEARQSLGRQLDVVCGRRNSIPSDVGFEAKRNDLIRLGFFSRRNRIGVRGAFVGAGAEKLKLSLSCVQGRGVTMAGRMGGARGSTAHSSLGVPQAHASAKRRKIVVRYSKVGAKPLTEPLFNGLLGIIDRKQRLPWGSPIPAAAFGAHSLAGRGFRDPQGARASRRSHRREAAQIILFGEVVEGKWRGGLWGSEMAAFGAFLFADKRTTDRASRVVGAPVPPKEPGRKKSKTVKFEPAFDCDPGFFVDIYIPSDAVEPIGHRFVGDPPCKNPKVVVEKFNPGTKPPGSTDPENGWSSHATYRIRISGDAGLATPYEIEMTWESPPA